MKINAIIVEDEPLAREKLEGFIARTDYINLVGSFGDALSALSFVKTEAVDLIYLDIQTGDFNGIQFMNALSRRPKIIIASAYPEYAVSGFDFGVTDYLLKPFSFERFLQSADKVFREIESEKPGTKRKFAFFKSGSKLEKVDFRDILYVEGLKDYLSIVTAKSKVLTKMTFAEMEQTLPKDDFVRVHKSYIIAVDKIDSVEKSFVNIRGRGIPVGPGYKDRFFERI